MSDFDKEAERERLREKYEHEEEKREVTERMSELLLKGATMTNAHCQDCGDPIFRYDGQEFCATCQKAVERTTGGEDAANAEGAGAADADDAADAETNGDREEIEVASPGEARVQFGGDEAPDSGAGDQETTTEQPSADVDGAEPAASRAQPQPASEPATPAQTEDAPLRTAHAALAREVSRLAQQAEASEDLGQKRDLLAATREAAEALTAVREAGR